MCPQPAYSKAAGADRSGTANPPLTAKSIRKMVVLFTDVVDSSKYFKAYGDLAGREMLRRHQELASGPVVAHGGVVVKVLGDSVMAFFTDPTEALKAAVKIQQGFFRHNQGGKGPREQIHVRIGLHYGDGIVEKGDIYGDVVNITAKFLPMVQGDQIAVTGELHDQVHGLAWARFEKMDLELTKDVLKKLVIYRVSWDQRADLNPAHISVLVLRPAWNLAKEEFQEVWQRLLAQKASLWPKTPGEHATLRDGTLVLFLKTPAAAPEMAHNALLFLKRGLGRGALPFVPVQILVDTGQFKKAGEPFLEELRESWTDVKPGEITVSAKAMKAVHVPSDMRVIQPHEGERSEFYRLVPKEGGEQSTPALFLYQASMVQGEHGPCFYCGDRRHPPAECPSKHLSDLTHGIERLGYQPLEAINELFFAYLNSGKAEDQGAHTTQANPHRDEDLAAHAFFELKRVFQLRFLRTLWNSTAEAWNRIKAENEDGERGGLIWIGQDCIRVSNLVQAENLLVDALGKIPGDFNALCAMGFLMIERGDLQRAKRFFKHALENGDITPRKIFVRLLLARTHELSGEIRQAEEHVRKALFMDSLCHEALYLEMIYKFRQGRHVEGLRRLRKLIESNRKIFIMVLIDPELAKFSERIQAEIQGILDKARTDAERISVRAAEEIGRMERLMGKDEAELKRARQNLEKIQELSRADSYFSLLDIIYYGTVIVQTAMRCHEDVRRKLLRAHGKLKERHEACVRFLRTYPYASLLGSLPQDLEAAGQTIHAIREVIRSNALERYKDAMAQVEATAGQMDRLEYRVRRLEKLRRLMGFTVDFLKKTVLLESAIAFISLLLFPVIGHYLNFLIPNLSFSPESIWVYQKGVLILGGFTGLFLAFLMSARKLGES